MKKNPAVFCMKIAKERKKHNNNGINNKNFYGNEGISERTSE